MKKQKLIMCLMALSLALVSCTKDETLVTMNFYGEVVDAITGEPLAGVSVQLSPGGFTTYTGSDGRYEFENIEPKQYTLTAQKVGYKTNRKSVNPTNEDNKCDITLTPVDQ